MKHKKQEIKDRNFTHRLVMENGILTIYRFAYISGSRASPLWQKLVKVAPRVHDINRAILKKKFPEAFENAVGDIGTIVSTVRIEK